ncbi:hypothetical protein, partial [Paraclostridium sordellii]
MKNITKNELVEILKNPKLDSQVKHFYLHEYIKNHEKVVFSEGIIDWKPEVWGLIPGDKRDKYTIVSYRGNMRYIFMSEMNVDMNGDLYFTNSVQNCVPISHQTYLTVINEEFIS